MKNDDLGSVSQFRSRERESDLGMTIEEQLRRVIQADRREFTSKVRSLKLKHNKEIKALQEEIESLRRLVKKNAEERPAENIASKIVSLKSKGA